MSSSSSLSSLSSVVSASSSSCNSLERLATGDSGGCRDDVVTENRMQLRDEFLEALKHIHESRYYNLRRAGRIVCRTCNHISNSPLLHIDHVKRHHAHLRKLCPYCQTEKLYIYSDNRMCGTTLLHLKSCCFFHKMENEKYRSLFSKYMGVTINCNVDVRSFYNDSVKLLKPQHTEYVQRQRTLVMKIPLLSLQPLVSEKDYMMSVLHYEISENYKQTPIQNSVTSTAAITIDNNIYANEICVVRQFFEKYTLDDTKRSPPSWWKVYISELSIDSGGVAFMVASNSLVFDPAQNIDCNLIRILSLHWTKFVAFYYAIPYEQFAENIHTIIHHINRESFLITRYMQMYEDSTNGGLKILMIIVAVRGTCLNFWKDITIKPVNIVEIESFDMFVDICYDISTNGKFDPIQFPPTEHVKILNINYHKDVLVSRSEPVVDMATVPCVMKKVQPDFCLFFSPLERFAKVYFYSQTQYGCVRAFDRILNNNNLATLITSVVQREGTSPPKFVINYSSLFGDLSADRDAFEIVLLPGQHFASEAYYRENRLRECEQTMLVDKNLFFLNENNIQLVVNDADDSTDAPRNILPNMLMATDIAYTLSKEQENIFKVAQYHREQILLENNSIPNFSYVLRENKYVLNC